MAYIIRKGHTAKRYSCKIIWGKKDIYYFDTVTGCRLRLRTNFIQS